MNLRQYIVLAIVFFGLNQDLEANNGYYGYYYYNPRIDGFRAGPGTWTRGRGYGLTFRGYGRGWDPIGYGWSGPLGGYNPCYIDPETGQMVCYL